MHGVIASSRESIVRVAWDLVGLQYDGVWSAGRSGENANIAIFFKPDGTRMYEYGFNIDYTTQWDLSPAWDLVSAVDNGVTQSMSSEAGNMWGHYVRTDGTLLYGISFDNGTFQYSMI